MILQYFGAELVKKQMVVDLQTVNFNKLIVEKYPSLALLKDIDSLSLM
jgi:hypothetical protein